MTLTLQTLKCLGDLVVTVVLVALLLVIHICVVHHLALPSHISKIIGTFVVDWT